MSNFCTGCGSPLIPGSSFCTSCGKKVDISSTHVNFPNPASHINTYNPAPYNNTIIKKPKKKKPLWVKLAIALLITAIIVTPLGYGIWKAGEVTGFWENRALKKALDEWQKQPDLKAEEQEIFAILNLFKTAISDNDFENAMKYVHPLSRDELTIIFTDNRDKIPEFVNAFNDMKLIFLSDDPGYFEASRVAEVEIGIPTSTQPIQGVSYIFLIKTEEGWMVEKIL